MVGDLGGGYAVSRGTVQSQGEEPSSRRDTHMDKKLCMKYFPPLAFLREITLYLYTPGLPAKYHIPRQQRYLHHQMKIPTLLSFLFSIKVGHNSKIISTLLSDFSTFSQEVFLPPGTQHTDRGYTANKQSAPF